MSQTRSIKILDNEGKPIGERRTASDTDILTYLAKGLVVVDFKTNEPICESDVTASMGISDGEMIME